MSEKSKTKESEHQRPRNKANMDEPQEEFIEAQSSHLDHDRGHGYEVATSFGGAYAGETDR